MLAFRTFRNTDPPVITGLWRSRSGQPGLFEPVSSDLFEQLVFAKLYFDYQGLILAEVDGRAVGFAHAAFGPNEQQDDVSVDLGVTNLILIRPECNGSEVAPGLLAHCEAYLRGRGAKVLYGGGVQPLNPFYLGLYGGSELPGVLDTDNVARDVYQTHGYTEIDQTVVLQRDLSDFEAVIDRQQMQIRRSMVVEVTVDPPPRTWWEACTLGQFDLTRFELVPRGGGPVVASATFRNMEPSGRGPIGRAAGLVDLTVDEAYRRRGLSIFLLCEALRQFIRQGITLVEAQCMHHNIAARGMYHKLGFQQVGQGSIFRKDAG